MDDHDALAALRDAPPQVIGVEIEAARQTVDENWARPRLNDDIAGGGKAEIGDEDLVAFSDAERDKRHVQGRGCRGRGAGVSRPCIVCEDRKSTRLNSRT